jgi:hypothetical protein
VVVKWWLLELRSNHLGKSSITGRYMWDSEDITILTLFILALTSRFHKSSIYLEFNIFLNFINQH